MWALTLSPTLLCTVYKMQFFFKLRSEPAKAWENYNSSRLAPKFHADCVTAVSLKFLLSNKLSIMFSLPQQKRSLICNTFSEKIISNSGHTFCEFCVFRLFLFLCEKLLHGPTLWRDATIDTAFWRSKTNAVPASYTVRNRTVHFSRGQ